MAAFRNQPDEAIEAFRRAIEIDPTQGIFHSELSSVLQAVNRLDEAEAAAREALRLSPAWPGTHIVMGRLYLARGHLAKAKAFKRTIELDPNNATAHFAMAQLQTQDRKIADARTSLERAIQCRPDYAEAQARLGELMLAEG